jgi:hypothetical protein
VSGLKHFRKYKKVHMFHRAEVPKLWGAPSGGLLVLWRGGVLCMRVIFILKEIWAKDKIYILAGTLLG